MLRWFSISFFYYFLRRVQRRASEKLSWDAAKFGAEKKWKNDDNLKTNWQWIPLICRHKYFYREIEGLKRKLTWNFLLPSLNLFLCFLTIGLTTRFAGRKTILLGIQNCGVWDPISISPDSWQYLIGLSSCPLFEDMEIRSEGQWVMATKRVDNKQV